MITISDDLAALLEQRRQQAGFTSLDAAAEAFITHGLEAGRLEEDHSLGFTDEELRAFLAEADASGPEEAWDPDAVRSEVLRRHAECSGTR